MSFFASSLGMKISAGLAIGGCLTGVGSFVAIHGPFIDKYREVVQMYKEGTERQLKEEIRVLAEQVVEDCKLQGYQRKIKFFTVCGFDTFHAGSSHMRWGSIVGIPSTFEYQRKENINRSEIQIRTNPEPVWSSPEGQDLLNSLVLSERAQKFAIAREIFWTTTPHPYINGLAIATGIMSGYGFGSFMNQRFNLITRVPFKIRLVMYAVSASFGGTLYLCVRDSVTQHWDHTTDDRASNINREYLLGGIEYYSKMLQRNASLRILMGKEGDKHYTSKGNIQSWLRTPHLPITYRLDQLKNKLTKQQTVSEEVGLSAAA